MSSPRSHSSDSTSSSPGSDVSFDKDIVFIETGEIAALKAAHAREMEELKASFQASLDSEKALRAIMDQMQAQNTEAREKLHQELAVLKQQLAEVKQQSSELLAENRGLKAKLTAEEAKAAPTTTATARPFNTLAGLGTPLLFPYQSFWLAQQRRLAGPNAATQTVATQTQASNSTQTEHHVPRSPSPSSPF